MQNTVHHKVRVLLALTEDRARYIEENYGSAIELVHSIADADIVYFDNADLIPRENVPGKKFILLQLIPHGVKVEVMKNLTLEKFFKPIVDIGNEFPTSVAG